MTLLFIRNSGIANPPWKAVRRHNGKGFDIVDANDRLIARAPWYSASMFDGPIYANIPLLAAAPEMLGALREIAFHMHRLGTPLGEPFYELINRVSVGMPPIEPPVRDLPPPETPLPGSD